MYRVINFGQLLGASNAVSALLDLVLRFQLNHLSSLANQVVPCRHGLSRRLLKLQESLKVYKAHVLHRAFDRHSENSGHLWKDR